MRNYIGLIDQATGAKKQIQKNLDRIWDKQKESAAELINIEKAQALLQQVAQDTQEQLKIHVEDIVQLALDAIFPDQYEFEIRFAIAYGKTSAELVFISKHSGYTIDPMVASGGGVVDVCSFALRLACWTLSRGVDKVMVFDEPFRFLSRDLQERAGSMLRELGSKLGLQIIITTHLIPLIEASDQAITITKDAKGISAAKADIRIG
jgi:DNA repair exonuclease SbcCD ATPase subunit